MSTIGIDVSIDPSGCVSGGRVATASLDQVEKAANEMAVAVNTGNKALATMPAAANDASKGARNFNGVLSQAGYQIADFASQVQYGGNVLGAFGVQAGQLLSVVNPLAGGILTVAGIVGGSYLMSLNQAEEATKSLTQRTREYIETSDNLTRNQGVKALASVTEELEKQREEATKVSAKIETLVVNLQRYPGSAKAAEWNAQLVDQRANLDTVNQEIEKNLQKQALYQQSVDGVARANKQASEAIADQAANLEILELRAKGANKEAFVLAATMRLGAEATAEQKQQAAALAEREYELINAQRTLNTTVREYDKDGAFLQSLENQAALIGLNAREAAMLRAEQQLSANATKEQIQLAREYAGAIFDSQQRSTRSPIDTSDRDFEASITGASRAIAAENESIFEQLQNQRDMILLYQETGIGDAQAHADALIAIQRRTYQEQANIVSSGLGSILRLQQAWGDDSSGIYKTLLVTQKAATLYSVLLSSYDAIGKAWASAPFPYNLGAVATATVETGALGAAVEAITPAFATGGYVYGAGTGTSDSIPARLSMGEFVMPARETSRYAPELNAMRAGTFDGGGSGDKRIVIENHTTGRIDSVQQSITADEVRIIIREEVPNVVAEEFTNPYSSTNRSFQQTYVAQRNL